MADIGTLKWIGDISLSLFFAAVAIYVLVKFIKLMLKEHREELAKKDADTEKMLMKLDEAHRVEREALMSRLSDMDVYQRDLTKDTYQLITGFKEQLASMQALRESEKIQIQELINEKRNLQSKIQDLSNKIELFLKND